MLSPIVSILRRHKRQANQPLNILTCPTHERYEIGLCKTGHNFYAYRSEQVKDWNSNYGEIPNNYVLLDPKLGPEQLPKEVEFDIVLSQNKFGQFQILAPIAYQLQLPFISLEHTLPMPFWDQNMRQQLANMRGAVNVFISEYSIGQWQWQPNNDTVVIHHGIDINLFCPPILGTLRDKHILSVVNDWINRDWCCNFSGWQRITKGLPVRVVGDTKGLSKPAPSIRALVTEYQCAQIFLNTSTISPVPTSLLEAMACGCACVSTATCMIPEIIQHGFNGFISNDETELIKYCKLLLDRPDLCEMVGKNARKTIVEKFSQETFIQKWNEIFRYVTQG